MSGVDLAVILVGAGEGRRMQGQGPKLLLDLNGRSLLERSAAAFLVHPSVSEIVAVVPGDLLPSTRRSFETMERPRAIRLSTAPGGATRRESVRLGLQAVGGGAAFIAVHDVARPLVTAALVTRVLEAAREHGAALPALPLRDSVKEVADGRVVRAVDRERLWAAQTPQIFTRDILARAHAHAEAQDSSGNPEAAGATDDAALVEALGAAVAVVTGERTNLKITEPADLVMARALIQSGLGEGP